MPKYQIILESDQQIEDDRFERYARFFFGDGGTFKVVLARNLEGIREEAWQKPAVLGCSGAIDREEFYAKMKLSEIKSKGFEDFI